MLDNRDESNLLTYYVWWRPYNFLQFFGRSMARYSVCHLKFTLWSSWIAIAKAAVARRKILHVHFSGASRAQKLHCLNLEAACMSELMPWIGREGSESLLMFAFVKSLLTLVEDSGTVACGRNWKTIIDESYLVGRVGRTLHSADLELTLF